ncbi:hypothetical protein [Acidimangrovimonas sediminis]|uniref:hypothetical protein n=1 Tax=Acidimangrovimonas sediminis TaxID=2056283 RepID=UPI0011AEE38E|nr:hypothetical protein [Acidimangrovimonas sediminis]
MEYDMRRKAKQVNKIDTPLETALRDLRAALLALKPAGADGFEGLLAVVLGKIARQDFRLAKSGLQNGMDGATFSSGSFISFEAKRYDTTINDNEVLTKITRLIGSSTPPDLWVLGATKGASTQLLEPMKSAAEKNGIGILVLDWPCASPVPPLAAACALAADETIAFVQRHVDDAKLLQKAQAALGTIKAAQQFGDAGAAIQEALNEPSYALANARRANRAWLDSVFADRGRAKGLFGQALAPSAAGPLQARQRPALLQQVQERLGSAPSHKIVALVGGEGHGKSWLLAQSWQSLDDRPLMVIIPASDLKPVAAYGSLTPYLVARLIQQTGESETEVIRKRWEARFAHWKEEPNTSSPRFVLWVDGLNQQPDFAWPRWLDDAAAVVEMYGGVLVVTSRETYFDEQIRRGVHTNVDVIRVPEWTPAERNEILASNCIDTGRVKPLVLARLQNPRILSIAFDLLDASGIENFTELSVERLLFEHIRMSARDGNGAETPDQFSKRLAQHAQEIIGRVRQQQREDRLIFNLANGGSGGHQLSEELLAVTAEHFFKSLPEDATLYTLSEEGLSLALGLSVIKALQRAERNDRNVSDALDELIEPIAALDKTAEAVFSGAMVASIDDKCAPAIKRALICGFLHLQNIDTSNYPAFAAVVRNATDAAMCALFDLVTTNRYAPNKDWLLAALRECRVNAVCWKIIGNHISSWLRAYSLDPEYGVLSSLSRDDPKKAAIELKKKKEELDQHVASLSTAEKLFLKEKMVLCEGFDPLSLSEHAFELLAGMPLNGFAEELVAYSFAYALNTSIHAPYDEFLALVRFNRSDWPETRDALRSASAFLTQDETSRTGRWALVAVLRGISTAEEADLEERLVVELIKDRPKFEGWRLVEKYCATDPCDPLSKRPDNLDETAERYRSIDAVELLKSRSMGAEDHFVKDARPGLARFDPETAIATQRRIAQSLVSRDDSDLMIGVTSLEPHCALLDAETVTKLLEISRSLSSPRESDDRGSRERWIAAQYALQIALPHLDGDEQLEALAGLPPHGPPLLKLAEVLRPASPEKLERVLGHAAQSGDHCRGLMALMFAAHSGTSLTKHSQILVAQFAVSEHSSVRALAMSIIASGKYEDLTKSIITSGWDANTLHPRDDHFEIWYGSSVLISGAEMDLLSVEAALDRITPRLYGRAATTLGESVRPAIGSRLGSAVQKALDVPIPFTPPIVEQQTESTGYHRPPLLSLAEPEEKQGPTAFFKQLSETPEEFQERQRQGWQSFDRFDAALTADKARLIVEDVGLAAVEAYVSCLRDHGAEFAAVLMTLDHIKLTRIYNFALMFAQCLSLYDPPLAKALFGHLSGNRAYVSLVHGPSEVSLEAICVWASSDSEDLDRLRSERLSAAETDHRLAQEVMAALYGGKEAFLERYVQNSLKSPVPTVVARALMVLGFGLQSPKAEELLADYKNAKGFVGAAAKSAQFAYDRNRWAQHWFEGLCNTDSAEEFWRFSVLLEKVVDARFAIWSPGVVRSGAAISRFEPSIGGAIERRVKLWKSKRESTLCGSKAPGEVYLVTE